MSDISSASGSCQNANQRPENISVACPSCGKRFAAPEHAIGKKARCTSCGNSFVITALTEDHRDDMPKAGVNGTSRQMNCWKCVGTLTVTPQVVGTRVECPYCSAPVYVPVELFPPNACDVKPTTSPDESPAIGKQGEMSKRIEALLTQEHMMSHQASMRIATLVGMPVLGAVLIGTRIGGLIGIAIGAFLGGVWGVVAVQRPSRLAKLSASWILSKTTRPEVHAKEYTSALDRKTILRSAITAITRCGHLLETPANGTTPEIEGIVYMSSLDRTPCHIACEIIRADDAGCTLRITVTALASTLFNRHIAQHAIDRVLNELRTCSASSTS